MFRRIILPLTLPLLLLSRPAACCTRTASFHAVLTSNCVSPAYYTALSVGPHFESAFATCAARCRDAPRCRAFAMEAARASDSKLLCLLFSFDACSSKLLLDPKSWDEPGGGGCANTKLRVFVKQSEGVEPGRLCPADYKWKSGVSGSRFKASLYKAAGNGEEADWSAQAIKCRRRVSISNGIDMPLTKLVDLSSVEEIQDVRASTGLTGSKQIWVGATALGNGSWAWADCGWPLPLADISSGGVWSPSGLNDGNGTDIKARICDSALFDMPNSRNYYGACECVDPFWYFTI